MGIREANNTLMPVYHCRKPVLLGKWPLLGVGLGWIRQSSFPTFKTLKMTQVSDATRTALAERDVQQHSQFC